MKSVYLTTSFKHNVNAFKLMRLLYQWWIKKVNTDFQKHYLPHRTYLQPMFRSNLIINWRLLYKIEKDRLQSIGDGNMHILLQYLNNDFLHLVIIYSVHKLQVWAKTLYRICQKCWESIHLMQLSSFFPNVP